METSLVASERLAASETHKIGVETENSHRFTNLFKRTIGNATFRLVAETILLKFAFTLINGSSSHYKIFFKVGAAFLVFVDIYRQRKNLVYEISLQYIIIRDKIFPQSPWFNEIIPGKLTLGAIPLRNHGHERKIHEAGVTAVLTMLESFEIHSKTPLSDPATPETWQRLGITHLHIESPDFFAVADEKIAQGVDFLHQEIQVKKGHACVHCKAGRGRSATIAICYLWKYQKVYDLSFKDHKEAIEYAKTRRLVVSINQWQEKAIERFAASCA